jgi:hypothetical protein
VLLMMMMMLMMDKAGDDHTFLCVGLCDPWDGIAKRLRATCNRSARTRWKEHVPAIGPYGCCSPHPCRTRVRAVPSNAFFQNKNNKKTNKSSVLHLKPQYTEVPHTTCLLQDMIMESCRLSCALFSDPKTERAKKKTLNQRKNASHSVINYEEEITFESARPLAAGRISTCRHWYVANE